MRPGLCLTAVCVVIALTATAAWAAKDSEATVSVFNKAPKVDGKIEPGEWDGAVGTTGFLSLNAHWLDGRTGRSMFGFTKERLYIAVLSKLPPDKKLMATRKYRDSDTVFDDSIEIWFDPNRDTRGTGEGGRDYYQFIGNSINTIYDIRFDVAKGAPDTGWNGDWEFANTVDAENDLWTAELSLPFKDIGWEGDAVGRSLGVLLARNFKRNWAQTTWFPHSGAFVSWFEFPRIWLTKDQPSVCITALGDNVHNGQLELRARVFNPAAARKVNVKLDVTSTDMPELKEEKTLDLAAGKAVDYAYNIPAGRLHDTAQHALTFSVASPDGKTVHLKYAMKWQKAPERIWNVRMGPNPDAAVQLAYYPSYNFIRVRVDTGELEKEADAIKSAKVTLADEEGKELLAEKMTWEKSPAEQEFKVGDLPDGQYAVTVALDGYKDAFARRFTRTHFVWEGSRLGCTGKVYPPFERMRVDGGEVAVVLRRYQVGKLGLWNSVKAEGNVSAGPLRELLAGPVSLKVDGGEALAGEGKFINVVEQLRRGNQVVREAALTDGQKVVYEGQAKHPAVTVKTRCTTEYDGCMKVEMELGPGAEKKELQSLWLEVPIKDELAPLWHCCTTSLRSNPTGLTPEGEGNIWDSSKFPDGTWYGNFKPYIWLGAEERGLCWFADNDKGWVLSVDEEKRTFAPCLSLHRQGGVVTLRVHFVQKPVTIEEPRKVVFGLMASPAKPMPKGWRRVLFDRHYPGCENIGWMGSTYWGTAETMRETYPLNGDMSILDKMQEMRLTRSSAGQEEFIRAWTQRNLSDYERRGRKPKEQILSLVRHSLGRSRIGHDYFNAYWEEFHGVSVHHPETQVFGNEWSGGYWKGGVHPLAPSYLDFQCWYGAEFVRRGVGLYFDNVNPKKAHDPVTTEAYRLPNGDIQPSANMWRHRDYFRRIWVLHQQVNPPETKAIMMFHMTNTHVVPYMGFGQTNLDLEWFYGPDPQQSKYPHELLRTESMGRQTGNIPLVLAAIQNTKSAEEKAIAERTQFGTMMVHEIRCRFYGVAWDLMKRTLDFGYGRDDCRVFNYWDETCPVKAADDRVKSLLLKRNGELMLVLCTWNAKPATETLTLDTKALGLTPAAATDEETGEALKLEGGKLTVPLDAYGVRLIRLK